MKIILFDLKSTGHHANYVCHFINQYVIQEIEAELIILVSSEFMKKHIEVASLPTKHNISTVSFIAISPEEEAELRKPRPLLGKLIRNFQEWNLMCKYSKSLNATHSLIMYLDTCEFPVLVGLTPPCKFSGIYFRPSFHYKSFSSHRSSALDWVQQWRDHLFLFSLFRNSNLENLFCLDSLAVESIKKLYSKANVVALADPVELPDVDIFRIEFLREKHNISSDKTIFLIFGSIDGRKGIYKLLESLQLVSPEDCKKICLLIVGSAKTSDRLRIQELVKVLKSQLPIQIVTHFGYVTNEEMEAYYCLSHIVLALYQKHVGMSGILLSAAAAQRPVISSDYGLMGELVRLYGLGLTVRSDCPTSIAQSITHVLNEDRQELCNLERMRSFVLENSAEKFARTIFYNLGIANKKCIRDVH